MQYGGFSIMQIGTDLKNSKYLSLVSMCNTASVSSYHQQMQRYATNEICIALLSNTENQL